LIAYPIKPERTKRNPLIILTFTEEGRKEVKKLKENYDV
jgi:hypothetical protein